MGSKGGGGYDTSGMEKATAEATALQKEIYEQTRADTQPWYNVGVEGVGKLADLMGLSGGSIQSRDQIYDELLPQYTQQQTTAGGDMFVAPTGQTVSRDNYMDILRKGTETDTAGMYFNALDRGDQDTLDFYDNYGFTQLNPQTTTESTDYEALNADIEARLASQGGDTPEGYGSLLERFGMDQFEEDPSYQYRQDESNKALERMMSAQGVTLGGGGEGEINPSVAKALQEQNQNMASMEYGNAYNRYGADQQNIYNRLMGVSGIGQNTTGQMASAGQQYATNTGNLTTGLASAQQQAAIAEASEPSMFGQILGSISPLYSAATGTGNAANMASMAFMSDRRLKENIKKVDEEKGFNIYEFNYIGRPTRYRGVIAQEVQDIEPKAVITTENGYLAVDYDMIGLKMERV